MQSHLVNPLASLVNKLRLIREDVTCPGLHTSRRPRVWTSVSSITLQNFQNESKISPSYLEKKSILPTLTNFSSVSAATMGASSQCTHCWENGCTHIGHERASPNFASTPQDPFHFSFSVSILAKQLIHRTCHVFRERYSPGSLTWTERQSS